uniref:Uncharacterized protein n=1 Tax=Lepeophtheirus salmonis TaxID=72036 RepID=A0A0K2T629_LEPSM
MTSADLESSSFHL